MHWFDGEFKKLKLLTRSRPHERSHVIGLVPVTVEVVPMLVEQVQVPVQMPVQMPVEVVPVHQSHDGEGSHSFWSFSTS